VKYFLQTLAGNETLFFLCGNNNAKHNDMNTIASASTKLQRHTRAIFAIQAATGLNRENASSMLIQWLHEDKLTWAQIAAELDA